MSMLSKSRVSKENLAFHLVISKRHSKQCELKTTCLSPEMRPAVEVLNQGWGNGTSTTPVNAAGLKGYWLKNPTLHENSLCPETL